jgi:hypothetical protein
VEGLHESRIMLVLPSFLQLQIVGDVPAPQSSDDVRNFYQYLFSIEPRDS